MAMKTLEAMPLDILEALRRCIEADDSRALGELLRTHPIDVCSAPFCETARTFKDGAGDIQQDGNEWHALGGRYAWCLKSEGQGGDESLCVTPLEFAHQRKSLKTKKLLEILELSTKANAKPLRNFD
mmetsp:Transcript_31939/g.107563  ORF Transcript_31939/g.107563 Transcript_31939/m.107563 type:complete len:127 (+) Transcript_31939:75-455(+)